MRSIARHLSLVLASLFTFLAHASAAGAQSAPSSSVQTTWRLLDYIAVDYAEAVRDGQVTNAFEYAEMREFARTARTNIAVLPNKAANNRLLEQAKALEDLIVAKRTPAQVDQAARSLAAALLAAHPVPLSPTEPPSLQRGKNLYAQQCAACHGVTGAADGSAARGLDPPPIAFTDRQRAEQRSIFALYQVITQGLEGTAMASFAELPEQDRWALAFYSGTLAYNEEQRRAGERLWRENEQVRRLVPSLEELVRVTPAGLAERIGAQRAEFVTAYLRSTPEASINTSGGSLGLARSRLADSVAAYSRGEREVAMQLALSAYLDGFEPSEGLLSTRDAGLMVQIETAMAKLRSLIERREPVPSVAQQAEMLSGLFSQAEAVLAPGEVSAASSFLGAFTILLREGLEALLIVIAMIAFLHKADRRDVLPYIHGGWIAALVAGLATWWAATSLIAVSGASRELMEGFGSLFAAAVLLSVGIWMHGKSNAEVWQRYIKSKLDRALSRQSAWFLSVLAFVVVYREVFETILFYATMWSQGGHQALLAGALSAALLLALIAWAMLRYSRKLPITQFFAFSSILIAVLAVVLAGKGVAGLQEAGLLSMTPLADVPRSDLLGLYPTVQTLLAQCSAALVIVLGFVGNRRAALASR